MRDVDCIGEHINNLAQSHLGLIRRIEELRGIFSELNKESLSTKGDELRGLMQDHSRSLETIGGVSPRIDSRGPALSGGGRQTLGRVVNLEEERVALQQATTKAAKAREIPSGGEKGLEGGAVELDGPAAVSSEQAEKDFSER